MLASPALLSVLDVRFFWEQERYHWASAARSMALKHGADEARGDAVAIVVAELVSNASRHAEGGRLRVTVHAKRMVRVTVGSLLCGTKRRPGLGLGMGAIGRLTDGVRVLKTSRAFFVTARFALGQSGLALQECR